MRGACALCGLKCRVSNTQLYLFGLHYKNEPRLTQKKILLFVPFYERRLRSVAYTSLRCLGAMFHVPHAVQFLPEYRRCGRWFFSAPAFVIFGRHKNSTLPYSTCGINCTWSYGVFGWRIVFLAKILAYDSYKESYSTWSDPKLPYQNEKTFCCCTTQKRQQRLLRKHQRTAFH